MTDMVPDLGVFGMGVAFGRPGEVEGPGWIQGLVMSREKLLVRVIIVVVIKF